MQLRNFLNFSLSVLLIGSILVYIPLAYKIFAFISVCLVGINLAEWLMIIIRKHFMYKKVNPRNKAVLITGCDSGFGNMLARKLDELGYRVFAGCLFPNGQGAKELSNSCSEKLTILDMDVTSDKSIKEAKEYITENLGTNVLWAVVNNAGIAQAGEVDWTSIEEFEKVYDVNAMGILRVTKTFLPFLKKSKGRIVNNVSISGRFTMPGFVAYCMSKSAAIALTTGLRIELAKWGIKAISIEPFLYRTPLTTTNTVCEMAERTWAQAPPELRREYGEHYRSNYRLSIIKTLNRCNLKIHEVVDCLEDAVTAEDPLNTYFPCRPTEKYLIKLSLALPHIILENYLRFELERFVKPAALCKRLNKT